MLNQNSFLTFSKAYKQALEDILKYGLFVDAVDNPLSPARHYGKKSSSKTLELLNYSFTVENPYNSLFFSEERIISLPYAVGLLIWSLAGSDDAEWLSYYHPNVKTIFDDASHLSGAFGKRMFNYNNIINQVDLVVQKLKQIPTTRRSTITITTPEDHVGNNIEFPCALGAQYFIRDNKLLSISYMRAQSAMVVMPYDVFLFMNIQIAIACKLGIEPGSYTHNCGTLHIYEDEIEKTKRVLQSKFTDISLPEIEQNNLSYDHFYQLITQEKNIRLNQDNYFFDDSKPYFYNIQHILKSYRNYKLGFTKFDEKDKFFPFFNHLPH